MLFRNHHPLEKGGALHLNKLDSPWVVWLELAQRFWRRFSNFVNVFSLFRNYLPLGKDRALHLYKLDSPWVVWLELAQRFWRRFSNFVNVFSLFRNYLPLGKDRALHLYKLKSPLLKDTLCQVWLKLALVLKKKKMKMGKV